MIYILSHALYLFCVIDIGDVIVTCSQIVIPRTDCPLIYLTVLVKLKTNNKYRAVQELLFRLLNIVYANL